LALFSLLLTACGNNAGAAGPPFRNIPDYITIGANQISTSSRDALRLWGEGLTNEDIVPLHYMVNVTSIFMERNQISDISPLAYLTNLENLILIGNQISDISPLVGLTNLMQLDLRNNQITELPSMADLVNLRALALSGNPIADIAPLAELTNLNRLDLSLNIVTDWSPVAHVDYVIGRPLHWRRITAATATPTPTPAPTPSPAPQADINYNLGDTVQFGGLNWVVLDIDGSYALVLLEIPIEAGRQFHIGLSSVTWETSDMRHFLNNQFLNRFGGGDVARIRETTVITNDNPWFGTPGGETVTDRIFLLSLEEVVQYFGDSGMLNAGIDPNARGFYEFSGEGHAPTQYGIFEFFLHDQYSAAREAGARGHWWWLRSSGASPMHAAAVWVNGELMVAGGFVDDELWNIGATVRPAMWLNLAYD
jgi:hypothetical protein